MGLTEENLTELRAILLGSLGPSAFGGAAAATADIAERLAQHDGWVSKYV